MDNLMPEEEKKRTSSDLRYALDSVYLYKVLRDYGLLYLYEDWPEPPEFVGESSDYEPDVVLGALLGISEAVWGHYSEHHEVHTMYFSHPAIMEYYRLCRVYAKQRDVPLRETPYMREAERFVRNQLDQDHYYCAYRLQTKINHKWACGIVFRMWPEFSGHLALLVLMAKIFDFYEQGLIRLKADLAEEKIDTQNKQCKEAA